MPPEQKERVPHPTKFKRKACLKRNDTSHAKKTAETNNAQLNGEVMLATFVRVFAQKVTILLSPVWAVGYAVTSQVYVKRELADYEWLKRRKHRNLIFNSRKFKRNLKEQNPLT